MISRRATTPLRSAVALLAAVAALAMLGLTAPRTQTTGDRTTARVDAGMTAGPASTPPEIIIVLSREAEPYRQAEAAFKSALSTSSPVPRTILLSALTADSAAASAAVPSTRFLAVGSEAALWLHQHLPTSSPLTYCIVADPSAAGLDSGNIRGVTTNISLKDQFAIIASALPDARSVGLLYRSDTDKGKKTVETVKAALPRSWSLHEVAVNEHKSAADAIETLVDAKIDVIWTYADNTVFDSATVKSLLLSSLRKKIPVYGFSAAFVRSGALIGAGVDIAAQGRMAAALLQEASSSPPKQPIHQETEFHIVVNTMVAERLSITLPKDFLSRASIVFDGN
ncbi:MAG: hypothetical protein H7Y88_02650 [Phycisphaerales bacterium]|nr:hypothetical protein [Phycisphaerales bacterium]